MPQPAKSRIIVSLNIFLAVANVQSFSNRIITRAHRCSGGKNSLVRRNVGIHSEASFQRRRYFRSDCESNTRIEAVAKRQIAIFDGAEFLSIASVLKEEGRFDDLISSDGSIDVDEIPSRRAGYVSFVTGTLEGDTNERILAIEKTASNGKQEYDANSDLFVKMDDETLIYKDSITTIPKSISDSDAISTASAAIPVRCAYGQHRKCRSVVLGGGDYACFIAKALVCLNDDKDRNDGMDSQVSLVTTRPMSLRDTPFNPLRNTGVNAMSPSVGQEEKGFSEVLGHFDVVIDTLGDEGNLDKINSLEQGVERVFGKVGVASKLKNENNCQRYISTLTESQKVVLKEGIIFARDPVLQYQKETEKSAPTVIPDNGEYEFMNIPSPKNFNQALQKLLDEKIIFPTDSNENGSHKNKKVFVRGCSFPDYAEIEIWPSDASEGSTVRYGFPGAQELALEARVDDMMTDNAAPEKKAPKRVQRNPYVTTLDTLSDVRQYIVDEKKDAIIFFNAPYCKTCKSITPLYQRMARVSKDVKGDSDFLFAKASTAGKPGKQLTFTFKIDSVPTFILFRNGKQFGKPFGAVKLPSKKLAAALENLKSGEEWDESIMDIQDSKKNNVQPTKIE